MGGSAHVADDMHHTTERLAAIAGQMSATTARMSIVTDHLSLLADDVHALPLAFTVLPHSAPPPASGATNSPATCTSRATASPTHSTTRRTRTEATNDSPAPVYP